MTDKARRRSNLLGILGVADGAGVVRLEERYASGVDDLWSALTEPDRLARWYGTVEGDLRQGGTFRLHVEAAGMDADGRIEVCDPPRRLKVITRETEASYRAGNGVPPFDETIEATLAADGAGTVLVVEVRGMPLDKIAYYGAGWQEHLEHLAAHLGGREPGGTEAHWDELVAAYLQLAAEGPI